MCQQIKGSEEITIVNEEFTRTNISNFEIILILLYVFQLASPLRKMGFFLQDYKCDSYSLYYTHSNIYTQSIF